MDRLMAAIDAETTAARKRTPARAVAGRFAAFIAGFSPRTLAVAASFAVAGDRVAGVPAGEHVRPSRKSHSRPRA